MSRYDADDTYCYPGTDVLRNKAEITNAEDLDAYEGELSTLRSLVTPKLACSSPVRLFDILIDHIY